MTYFRTTIFVFALAVSFATAAPVRAASFDIASFLSVYNKIISLLTNNSSAQLSQVVSSVSNGLIGYWPLNEGGGSAINDSSGHGNTGSLLGNPQWTSGQIKQAIYFDGIDDQVTLGDSPFDFGTNSFSVSFWIKPSDTSSQKEQVVIAKVNASLAKGWRISQIGNVINLWVRAGSVTTTAAHSPAVVNGEWTHAVAVVDQSAGTIKVYANAVPGTSGSIAQFGSFDTPGTLLRFAGYRADSSMIFKGALDEVKIYNRALSASEVSAIYAADTAPQAADTTAPTTPGNLTASGVEGTQTTLTWIASTDDSRVAGYKILKNGTLLTTTTNTTYTDTTLVPDTSYTFSISAYDDAGNSSSPITTTVKTPSSNLELAAGTADQISQYGITWFFDKAYPYGKFANGDYWVLGPVTIVKITPDFNGVHNGFDVNPVFAGPQGYEIGAGNFSASDVPALPYIAKPGDSIVKAISIVQDKNVTSKCYPGCLQTAAVLTVVGSVPVDGGATLFRPPYVGTSKPFYSIKDIRTDLLPSLAPVSGTPSLAQITDSFARVQLDHKGGLTGRVIKPVDNLPDYGGAVAVQVNNAALRLMLNDPLSQKMPALINFLQAGIDRYHAVLNGQTWPDGGGHEPGRKLSLAFTAVLLNNQGMKDIVKNSQFFSENIGIRDGKNGALFGFTTFEGSELSYWNYLKNDPGYNLEQPDPYGYIDGGMNEVRDADGYQLCCLSQPWKASGLAALLIPEIKTVFNSSKFFEYIDRWVTVGVTAQPDPCAPLSQGGGPLLDGAGRYQKKCILDPDLEPTSPLVLGTGTSFTCQPGKLCGRYPLRQGIHKDDGFYGNGFQNAMWNTYRQTAGVLNSPVSNPTTNTSSGTQPSTPVATPTPTPIVMPSQGIPNTVPQNAAISIPSVGPETNNGANITLPATARTLELLPATRSITTETTPSDTIARINTFLYYEGYLSSMSADKNFYTHVTEQAVQKFQKAYNIVSSGTPATTGYGAVGPRTRNIINMIIALKYKPTQTKLNSNSSFAFTRSLTYGSRGNDVLELQKFLNTHGFTVAATGAGSLGNETTFFGTATRKAVARFQAAYHITPAAGYFGPITRAKITTIK